MNLRWLELLGAFALLGATFNFTAGCKAASCESVCESRNDCDGQQQTADCAAFCDDARQSAETAGCTDTYDALLSCQGTIDICSSDTFCAGQSAAFFKCVSDACSADPSKCSGS
jgi:hypothetical protein